MIYATGVVGEMLHWSASDIIGCSLRRVLTENGMFLTFSGMLRVVTDNGTDRAQVCPGPLEFAAGIMRAESVDHWPALALAIGAR